MNLPWWASVALTLLLLGIATAWIWRRARTAALRTVDVAVPSEVEMIAARTAGEALAARGLPGLVLAGGGAKGAYQIGCWKALRECGVMQFGAIAGCSVGSLNAVLVAQGDLDKAERIWHDMRFGRVFRLRWHVVFAVAIRVVLFVPYLGKFMFPARAINVAMWRAVSAYRSAGREAEPGRQLYAVWQLFLGFVRRPDSSDLVGNLVLAAFTLVGISGWWMLAAPLLTLPVLFIVVPLALFMLVAYTSWLVAFLDQLSTRLVLATNEPLHQLLVECVDVAALKSINRPLFVTLASLREVTRTETLMPLPRRMRPAPAPAPTAPTGPPSWWKKNVIGEGDFAAYSSRDFGDGPGNDAAPSLVTVAPLTVTTVEYVPSHFNVRTAAAGEVNELILQSAGLPEMFPARRIGEHTYVDGGIVDLVPLAALADVPDLAAIIVVPLDATVDEAAVRKSLAANLERLGHAAATQPLPELVLLTPSRPLGNFFTGTLDFAAVRARALLEMGYRDTIRRLAQRSPTEV